MTHVYSASGSRRSAVFTAIIALHFALFLVVINDQVPAVRVKPYDPPRVRLLPPPPIPRNVVPPDAPDQFEFGDEVVSEPVIRLPIFDTSEAEPSMPTDGGDFLPRGAPVVRVAASLQGRSSGFANVIRACYPASARRAGEEGTVLTAVTIGSQGPIRSWRVVQSSGFPRLDAAAPCVLDRLNFNAAREDGRAVQSEVLLPIVFRLD